MSPISDLPSRVQHAVESALEAPLLSAERQTAGTHGQTHLVVTSRGKWILRLRKGPQHRLRHALAAQCRAAALGVRVPKVVAFDVDCADVDGYAWMVEEYVPGSHFYPQQMDRPAKRLVCADMGRQLRLLHAVETSGFGELSADLSRGAHHRWCEWLEEQENHLDDAVRMGSLRSPSVARARAAYALLRIEHVESPRFCHGDFADDNLVIRNGRLAAVIDWELAMGGDPAHEIAYWFMWHQDRECLAALLRGYRPADAAAFRRRIGAHLILAAVKFIVWFASRGDTKNVEYCRGILEDQHVLS